MAERMIMEWGLAVLRVRLDLTERMPAVSSELVAYPDGHEHRYWTRRDALADFGIGSGQGVPDHMTVPDGLRDAVAGSVAQDLDDETALWLRLVPPTGYLGAAPWESVLTQATYVPLLRVPDRLPVGVDAGPEWSIALAVNASAGDTWATPYVHALMNALRNNVGLPVTVDLFADAQTYSELAPAPPEGLTLHDPAAASAASAERTSRGVRQFRSSAWSGSTRDARSARGAPGALWADWIVEGLAGRSVRALQVVTDAALDGDLALLTITDDPSHRTERSACRYVTGDDVRLLADTIGASTLTFVSPPGNTGDLATRLLADGIGVQRPGPTLYSSLSEDEGGDVLSMAYAYLARPGGSVPVPLHRSLFAYLQPEHVLGSLTQAWPQLEEADDPFSALAASTATPVETLNGLFQETPIPGWVASSERYVDDGLARLSKASAGLSATTEPKAAYNAGMATALDELRQLVVRHATPS